MRTTTRSALVVMALLAAAGCAKSRPTQGGAGGPVTVPAGGPGGGTVTVNPSSCTACHGEPARLVGADTNPLIASAPPRGLLGELSGRPVGAHDAHLRDGAFSRALACANCHLMPGSSSTHPPQALQGKVTFTNVLPNASAAWLGLSTGTPGWDGGTCSATYCHGNFPGGNAVAISWLTGAVQCGSCHGTPPTVIRNGGTHPAATGCEGCHGTGYSATAIAGAALATHVDGNVTLAGSGACDSCHGQPPSGPTTLPGSAGSTHPPRSDCGSCHPGATGPGPGQEAGPGHQDGAVSLVTLSCTTCHGTASRPDAGGAGTYDPFQEAAPPVDVAGAPVGGAHLAHVNPAASGQVYAPISCGECHQGAVPGATTFLHANGTTAVAFGTVATLDGAAPSYTGASPTCNATYCHGGTLGAAYAGSVTSWTWGGSATGCATCHALPPTSSAHTGIASAATACAPCHGDTVNADGTINVAGGLHINGSADITGSSCTACHGDNSPAPRTNFSTAAPPRDHLGNVATSFRGVGAHATHLATDGRSLQVQCTDCHATPGSGATHNDGTANVTLASRLGAAGSYSAANLTCSSTYCHGNFAFGNGTGATPAWNATTGVPLACTGCHGSPPPIATDHPQNSACGTCHTGYAAGSVARATHVDGQLSIDAARTGCVACHGTPGRASVAGADANQAAAPPVASSEANPNAAGAHLAHVNTAVVRSAPLGCAECHTVPAAGDRTHVNGSTTASVVFAPASLARANGSAPVYAGGASPTCSATWCHARAGATTPAPSWNATLTGCTTCHGAPPPVASGHVARTDCATCHGTGYAQAAVTGAALATHVNGTVNLVAMSCTTCHGTAGRGNATGLGAFDANQAAAPPADTAGASSGNVVGAHQAHVNPSATGQTFVPVDCNECHAGASAYTTGHADGARTISFAAASHADLGGVTPTFTAGTPGSCSVYCHGAGFGAASRGTVATWSWTGAAAACDSCHATPPDTAGHTSLAKPSPVTACASCHGETVNSSGAIVFTGTGAAATTTHINGLVEGGESSGGQNCGGCHAATFEAMNGTTPSLATKHLLGAVAGVNDLAGVGTADWTTGTGLTGAVGAANRSCGNMCHGDHPHALGATTTHENNVYLDARTPTARGSTASASTRAATDFVASGQGGLCISCHQRPLDATVGRVTLTQASYAGSGHDFTSNTVGATTYTWQFLLHDGSAFQRNCTKCHAGGTGEDQASVGGTNLGSVHYSQNDSLLMGTPTAAGGTATVASFVCYKCHGTATTGTTFPMNRSGKDVYLQAQKAEGHGGAAGATPKNIANSNHSTLAEASATYNSGAFSGANRHVTCLDCHDPHEAGKVLHAVGGATGNQIATTSPLRGAYGVTFTSPATNWAATASGNFSSGLVVATREYEICLKCHSSFAFGATPPAATATPSGLAETDVAQEFSTSNQSYHPVLGALPATDPGTNGSSRLAASQLVNGWTPGEVMTCSDCHGTDAASPAAQGPHGSAITFMLAGTNKAWPYTVAGANSGTLFRLSTSETGIGTNNGLFCRNCHPNPTSTASNNMHRLSGIGSGEHAGSAITDCTDCHVRIPHGGKVSRLIVTTNAPARYKVGTSNFSSFTKAASYTGYSVSNIGSSCGEHAATRTEAW